MKQNKNKNHISETYTVPTDVMLEIAQIIVQADLPHEIIGVKENKRQVVLEISYQADLRFHQQAIDNITDILREYQVLCNEDTENINWRES
ncbi:MAG: hypothetical protein ABI388_04570 [Bacteroidia bacterium]